ncbi:carbon-nitrogen hydrolase family protein [Corynebacterium felinum]|uniref:Amidohydrolase n=1 Tax=Corynebacterium felinum TaxID=131318 RepID=A0ABU2B5P2_9CORY|nr:carbon-nitrogen hydrolase family protein [Corynebacterium felinum]MDF5820188.1 carbon-nitrogen hydrolase family protein [Corynebacterium felinum]MDR7353941.1 putative amidohydrolase [Corynebacterium felinum]WJY96114.1 2-oxoglutaramate amidase [Corynebacterium felinum]
MDKLRIALGQISTTVDKLANLALIEDATRTAAQQGAELILFPEASMQAFGTGRLDGNAEALDGTFVSRLKQLARTYNIAIVCGIFSPADTIERNGKTINRISNVAVACLPSPHDGEVEVVDYAKIHTYDAFGYRESDTVKPGTELVTFDYRNQRFGLAICYDLRFPEQFRQLAQRGATIMLVPISWADGPGKLEQRQLLQRARALDSTSYLLACDQARPDAQEQRTRGAAPTGVGYSAVIGPEGVELASLESHPDVLIYDLDLGAPAALRKTLPVLEVEEKY